MIIEILPVGQMQTNCYLVVGKKSRKTLIIDPGDDAEYIQNKIRDLEVEPVQILATHGHFDHIMAAFEIQQAYQIPFLISSRDEFLVKRMRETAKFFLKIEIPEIPPVVDRYLKEGDQIQLGDSIFFAHETPGHTPGSICLYSQESKVMFTGDTIFAGGGVGRTDFAYSNRRDLEKSVLRILKYDEITTLYPGHGETTTVADEKKYYQN